jgi:hypothetical protein
MTSHPCFRWSKPVLTATTFKPTNVSGSYMWSLYWPWYFPFLHSIFLTRVSKKCLCENFFPPHEERGITVQNGQA